MVNNILTGRSYYWRFLGEKTFRYGYALFLGNGLFRMGSYNGDVNGGCVVKASEIEAEEYIVY
jgi:hypothetical protein